MPVKFKGLGKAVKDLLGKNYDYNYKLETVNKSKDGKKLTSGFVVEGRTLLAGNAKYEYVDSTFGEVTVAMKVKGEKEDELTELSAKFDQLTPGLELSLSCNVLPYVNLTADYVKDSVAVQAALDTDFKFTDTAVSGNGAFTYNNFSLGLSGAFDVSKSAPKAYDAALQFKQNEHTVSLQTKKLFSTFVAGYHNKGCDACTIAVQGQVKKDGSDPKGILGLNYAVNPTTTLKAKVDTLRSLSYSIEYKLSNPAMKVNFAHELKHSGSADFDTTNWGFGLTLGDY